jgi:hypothetical protein
LWWSANADSNTNADTDGDADAYSDGDTDAVANANADSDTNADTNSDANSELYPFDQSGFPNCEPRAKYDLHHHHHENLVYLSGDAVGKRSG